MHDGMYGHGPSPFSKSKSKSDSILSSISGGAIPVIPGSLPVPVWLLVSPPVAVVRPWCELAAEMLAAVDSPCRPRGERQVTLSTLESERDARPRSRREHQPVTGWRTRTTTRLGFASARATRATEAAATAASGG
jgi:hypothetical protein